MSCSIVQLQWQKEKEGEALLVILGVEDQLYKAASQLRAVFKSLVHLLFLALNIVCTNNLQFCSFGVRIADYNLKGKAVVCTSIAVQIL